MYFEADPDPFVAGLLRKSGLLEYKSVKAGFETAELRQEIRTKMNNYLRSNGKIGLVIAPVTARTHLGEYALSCLMRILTQNELGAAHVVYFDREVFTSKTQGSIIAKKLEIPTEIKLNFEEDSKETRGIQFADLVAHNFATRLKAGLSGNDKLVMIQDEEQAEYSEVRLSFELFVNLRNSVFIDGTPLGEEMPELAMSRATGLFIAPECGEDLKQKAHELFGVVYLGCVH